MSNTAAVCDSFKQDILQGVHQPGDNYYASLYTASGTLSKSTTAYTASGEVSGTGYTAGGTALSGFTVSISGDTAYLTFSNPSWTTSTLTGVVACLIYNASRSNKAVGVLTFASTSTTAGTFTVVFPAAGASSTLTIS